MKLDSARSLFLGNPNKNERLTDKLNKDSQIRETHDSLTYDMKERMESRTLEKRGSSECPLRKY